MTELRDDPTVRFEDSPRAREALIQRMAWHEMIGGYLVRRLVPKRAKTS